MFTGSCEDSLTHTITVEIDVAADSRAEAFHYVGLLFGHGVHSDHASLRSWRFAIHERPDLPDLPALLGEHTPE